MVVVWGGFWPEERWYGVKFHGGEATGIKVTERRPGREPFGQGQWWLWMWQWWRADGKYNSACVCDRLDMGLRGEGPGQHRWWPELGHLSLIGQDDVRKEQILRRDWKLGLLSGVMRDPTVGSLWSRLSSGGRSLIQL